MPTTSPASMHLSTYTMPPLAIQSHPPGLPPSRQETTLPSLASPFTMQCNTVPPPMPPSKATSSKRAKACAPPSSNLQNLPINLPCLPSQPNHLLLHQLANQSLIPPYPSPTSSTSQKCRSPDSTPITQADFPSEHEGATNTSQSPTTNSPMLSYVRHMPTELMHIVLPPTTPSCTASPNMASQWPSKSSTTRPAQTSKPTSKTNGRQSANSSLLMSIAATLPNKPSKPSNPISLPSLLIYLPHSLATSGTCSSRKPNSLSTYFANPPSCLACLPGSTSMAPSTKMPPHSYHLAALSSFTTNLPPAAPGTSTAQTVPT